MNPPQETARWTVFRLTQLGTERLDQLTRQTAGHLTCCRVLLGRCLLVMHRTDGVSRFGCSSAIQYAGMLGLCKRVAGECIRVATRLEELPLLRSAADAGAIGWSSLREITHKATPETEERWLELAQRYNYGIVENLVGVTETGEEPPEPEFALDREPVETMLRLKVPAHVMALLQRAVRALSHEAGRPLAVVEALEYLCAEYLGGTVAEWRRETAKDLAARQRHHDHEAPQTHGHPSDADPRPSSASPVRVDEEDTPPSAALAVRKWIDPTLPIDVAVPDRDTGWSNPRLRFSGSARAATPAQKAELMRRDGYCCANPGCRNKLWLDVHHVVFYYMGGVTLPDNLIVVCTRCHRNLHRGWLKVSGTAPHGLVWTDRTGARLERALALGT